MINDLDSKLPGILREMADKIESGGADITKSSVEFYVFLPKPIGHAEIVSLDNKVKINVDYQY